MIIGESDLEENDIYYAQNLTSIQNIHQTGATEENVEEVRIVVAYFTYTLIIIINFFRQYLF